MTNQEIKTLIETHPEAVIAAAIEFNPEIAYLVDAVRKAPGPLSGVAASAMRHALTMNGHKTSEAPALLALVKIPS